MTTAIFTRASVAYKQDGSQVASGQPRYELSKSGLGGKAIMVEEGTVNLCSVTAYNPLPTGWTVLANIVAGPCSVSFFFSSASGGQIIIADNGSEDLPYQYITGTAVPTWHSRSFTSTATQGFAIYTSATDVVLTRIQVEAKSYPTSFTVGARLAETLALPTGVLTASGTIAFWIYKPAAGPLAGTSYGAGIVALNYGSPNSIGITHDNGGANEIWNARCTSSAGAAFVASVQKTLPAGWRHFAVTWSGSSLALYIDGDSVAAHNACVLPSSYAGTLYIGSLNAAGQVNTLIDDLRIFSRALSAAEIQAVFKREVA